MNNEYNTNRKNILIIGIGNEFRSDDRIGIEVARLLKARHLQNVEVIEETGDCTALMERWKDADAVILINAVSSGVKPRIIYRIDVH